MKTRVQKSKIRSGLEGPADLEDLEGAHGNQQGGIQRRTLCSRRGMRGNFEGRTDQEGRTDYERKSLLGGGHPVDEGVHLDRLAGSNSTPTAYGTGTRAVAGPIHHSKSPEPGQHRSVN